MPNPCAFTGFVLALLAVGPPASPRDEVVRSGRELEKAKSYALTWTYHLGLSNRPDHELSFVAFFQEYEIQAYAGVFRIPALNAFRKGRRGALTVDERWQTLESHPVGKWLAVLFSDPAELLAQAVKRGRRHERSPDAKSIRVELFRRDAAEHYAAVVQSGCMAGKGEALSRFLDRVDNTRTEGHYDLELDAETGRLRRLILYIAVGRTGKRVPGKSLGDEEHVVVRSEYRIRDLDEVEPFAIPAAAWKLLTR